MTLQYSSPLYFIVFLGAVFVLYTVFPKKLKWLVLLLSSYIFYWINSGALAFFLLATTAVIYFAGVFLGRIQRGWDVARKSIPKEAKDEKKKLKAIIGWQKKAVVSVSLTVVFGLLVFLKYYGFLSGNANSLLSLLHIEAQLPELKLVLPLGISYYTLQAASYVIDVYRGKYPPTENFFKIALFLSFFPQIVEGPIGRYDLLGEQLYEGHKISYTDTTQGLQLIAWGLMKKMVIADRINILVANVFKDWESYGGGVILFAGLMYTVQIYAEFSGCMDIVTGSSQMFGVRLSENFSRPFFSKSVSEFWRRWHITLGAWLRDYIFYTVSLSKPFARLSKWAKEHLNEFFGALVPSAAALFCVWVMNGVWHGSGWKYLCYGMYYYVIMMISALFEPLFVKFFEKTHIRREKGPFAVFRILRTCFLVVIGMTLFRASGVGEFFSMMGKVFTSFGAADIGSGALMELGLDGADYIIIAVCTALVFIVSVLQEKGHMIRSELGQKNIVLRWTVYLALVMLIVICGAYGTGYDQVDFIYGQF